METTTAATTMEPRAIEDGSKRSATTEVVNAASPALESFVDFRRVLFTMLTDLKRLRAFEEQLHLDKSVQLIDEVIERVENNCFTIAVVGEFKRGKSTLINALMGQEILPADILPTSATLNRVTYGLKKRVKIEFKDGRVEEIPIDKLPDYVTRLTPEAEAIAATIKEAVVYYPVNYLQNNVDIVDTPGLNDDQNMTSVTLSVLPRVDAAILVILAQSPFSEYERDFLETRLLTSDMGRIIFVVTAIDRCNTPADAERVIANIKGRIKGYIMDRAQKQYGTDSEEYRVYLKKIGEPKVFGLSAHQALQAKHTGDPELLRKSRFDAFEASLQKFLLEERGAIMLQVPVNRAIAAATEILKTLTVRENALGMKGDDFRAAYDSTVQEIERLRLRKAEESQKIDQAAVAVKARVQPLVDGLEEKLQQAAAGAIEFTAITADDIGDESRDATKERVGRAISDAVQKTSREVAEAIQLEVQRAVALEADRLQEFASMIDQMLTRVEMQFVDVKTEMTEGQSPGGEGVAATISVVTGWGGIWSGYHIGGIGGAVTGGIASLGTAIGAGILVTLLGLAVTWPVVIAVGVLSVFTGGWLTKVLLGDKLVENFKKAYQEAVAKEITEQLRTNHIDRQVNDYILTTFAALKQKLQQEVDALLDNTQATLTELRGKRERDETLTAGEKEEICSVRAEAQKILGNAQRLSDQLIEIMSV